MDTMHKLRAAIMKILGVVITLLFILMTLVGTYQIVTRYFFNRPSTISEELLTYSFTWMSLLASAYVFGKRDHMRMGFMADKLTGPDRRYLEVFIDALSFFFAGVVMVYGGISITKLTMIQITASLRISMGWIYIIVPIAGLLIMVFSVMNAADMLHTRGGKGMSIAVFCGLVIFVLLAVMLLAGVPIAIALAVSSICAILPVLNLGASVLTGAQRIFSGISVFSLLAIPFFILAGNIMNKGGIAIRLINFAKLFTGSIPGALAHTNAVANMLFGAISGSGTAAASAMGSIIGPIEEEEGYDRDFSAAANIATAPTGLLIPPSNVMITFSLVSGGTSVAALFMAGYIPGILWGLACMVVIYFFARKKGYRSTKRYTGSVKVFFQAIPCLFMIIVVIGGIISGIFTATEGSVVAVVYSMVLSIFFYKSIRLRELPKIFLDSAEMTGIIIFLIGVSSIMSWVMAFTGIPTAVSEAMLGISTNRYVILFIINILLLIVGTFMDMTPACLIFTPIFLPICQALGMNTIHFGIMMIFNLCIGTITPPVGTTLFVGVKVGKTKIEQVIRPLLYYFGAIFIVLMLVSYIPQLSLWLPGLMGYV